MVVVLTKHSSTTGKFKLPIFFSETFAYSNVATRLLLTPKISKKSIQNGLACESSLAASAQVLANYRALDLISF